jgi:hypothetical protein
VNSQEGTGLDPSTGVALIAVLRSLRFLLLLIPMVLMEKDLPFLPHLLRQGQDLKISFLGVFVE